MVDKFCQKLLTSGYTEQQTRRVTLCGIRGWERRKRRALEERGKIFRTSGESHLGRIKKKTTGKTNWFRKSGKKSKGEEKKTSNQEKTAGLNTGRSRNDNQHQPENTNTTTTKEDVRTATVLFVENTKGGELAKRLRGVVERETQKDPRV